MQDGNRTLKLSDNERSRYKGNKPFKPRPSSAPRNQAPKGHDAALKDAQDNAKPAKIQMMNGEALQGYIANRDKFTITLRQDSEFTIIFKHAIETIKISHPVDESGNPVTLVAHGEGKVT